MCEVSIVGTVRSLTANHEVLCSIPGLNFGQPFTTLSVDRDVKLLV